ncbi:MAG: hypothetical protein VX228_12205, partial [Pseudomonadota bacterium]|nr:hypothetical protein [Pseudomonadota bacterium]
MRVHICAVGRLRAGPEKALIDDYTQRFDRTGRPHGLGPLSFHEVEDKKGGGMAAEAAAEAAASLAALDGFGGLAAFGCGGGFGGFGCGGGRG